MADDNPLLEAQREKSGSQTYDKYQYQYHWALYKIITEHSARAEYAVFVELHEDVVICDCLDANSAKFELNQVKTLAKKISHNELVKQKNKVKGTSILAKLISNANGKAYSSRIKELNLVSTSTFSLELKKKGIILQKITLNDLSDTQLKKLEEAVENEFGKGATVPKNLQFILSELSDTKYQNDIIAEISKLINQLHPGSYFNPNDVYRILIDELNQRGVISYDFAKWDELLSKKALTSVKVNSVINQFTNIKDESKIFAAFESIVTEMNLGAIVRRNLRYKFDRYRLSRLGNKSILQLETSNAITEIIRQEIKSGETSFHNLLHSVISKIDVKYKDPFVDEPSLQAAIICEFIYDNE